jgi:AcrR family transcriptional regulator
VPPEINVQERLSAIAEATPQLVRDEGTRGVTVRAVAKKLGGSTSLVTKYVPSRIDLLRNAIAFVSTNWDEDLAAALDGREGMSKLRALASWSLQTNNYDDAIRRLWIEALAGTAPEATEEIAAAKEQAQSEYQFVLAVTKEAGQDKQLADALFLAFRGYYLSSIEDPEHWPAERAQEAVLKVLDMLDKRAR